MRKMVTATALVLALAAPGAANGDGTVASLYSGNTLLQLCQSHPQGPNPVFCMGYIAGIADALGTGSSIAGWRACFPHNGTVGRVRDIAVGFLTAHPEVRHLTAASLVAEALQGAFPCK
jgi:hypothetical protein